MGQGDETAPVDKAKEDDGGDILRALPQRVLEGDEGLTPEEEVDPDISFWAYLGWCARQPATPSATLTAWREDRFRFSDGLRSASC